MADLPINTIDLVVLVVMLISGLVAFSRGFIRELLSIGAWIGAFFAGIHGYPHLESTVGDLLPEPTYAPWVAGTGIGIVALIVLSLVGHHLARALRIDGLGAIDRSLGFLFGLARGAVLVALLFVAVQWLVEESDYPDWLRGAKTLPMARTGADLLVQMLPPHLRPQTGSFAPEAQRAANELILEQLVSPPVKEAPTPGDSGYTEQERKDLEGVIRNMR